MKKEFASLWKDLITSLLSKKLVKSLLFTCTQEIDEPALIPHIAEASSKKYPYEVLFRSLHKLLMDTATSEYDKFLSLTYLIRYHWDNFGEKSSLLCFSLGIFQVLIL